MKTGYLKLLFFIFIVQQSFGQVKEFDKLEMFFDQGHYKLVYRKSKLLLDNPVYDYSLLPNYYKGVSALMLSGNKGWLRRHSKAIYDDIKTLETVLLAKDWDKHRDAKNEELSRLKDSLLVWTPLFDDEELKKVVLNFYQNFLSGIDVQPKKKNPSKPTISKSREELIVFTESLIGVPYVYAGETPKGFDCSGFVFYVFQQKYGIELPRKASDQQESSEVIKEKELMPGDLIFFDSGKGVSHVGIIYSVNEGVIQMIHASSSKGIIITDVTNSTYWKNKIHSFGRIRNQN